MNPLSAILPGFIPNDLQRAALTRMGEYRNELKTTYGLEMRSAMELEFMIENQQKQLIPGTINMDFAKRWLQSAEGANLPYIDKLEVEGAIGRGKQKPHEATQYEINLDDRVFLRPESVRKHRSLPELVAATAYRLKTHSLAAMLQQTTCLTPAGIAQMPSLRPSFAAYHAPFAGADDTSALHINVSLLDRQGKNLLARSRHLMRHCAESLLEVQNEAGLAFLPTRTSLLRIGANSSAPHGLGVVVGKYFPHNNTSVAIRGEYTQPTPYDTEDARIENRLPGADVDPFVAMAVTMAAMVHALRKNVTVREGEDGKKQLVIKPASGDIRQLLNRRAGQVAMGDQPPVG
ncbi:MAG: glutamine synthetase, partial [Rickettsiales bacterium]|nr:glutamine synthetase [Rickettsiales bacterium]